MSAKQDFIDQIKSQGAILLPASTDRAIVLAQNALQGMRSAIIPTDFIDLFHNDCGGIILGDSEIFGPEEHDRPGSSYSMPSIIQINREINGLPGMRGRTVFGRNGLFWFCFDAFGYCYMLDILNLNPMRKYQDSWRAMLDCLAVGKI